MTRRTIVDIDALNRRPDLERVEPDPRSTPPPMPMRRSPAFVRPLLVALALALAVLGGVSLLARTTGAARAMETRAAQLRELLARCRNDPARFAWSVLGRDKGTRPDGTPYDRSYWPRQREICRSVVECRTTVVPAGNAVGKSYVASGIVLWFLYTRPSIVFTTAPTQYTLESVLWEEIRAAHAGSRLELGGKIGGSAPITLELGDKWFAYGHVSNKVEAMSGKHKRDLMAVVDEASGAPDVVFEALNSLKPSRVLMIGNPLRPEGKFYELCKQAEGGADPDVLRRIVIPSTESPDAHLEESPRGMADATWLRAMASEYGEESLWWLSHVLALFPGDASDALIPRAWLELAGRTIHVASGPRRMAIDLGLGMGGGDRTVIVCRDDNGVIGWAFSRTWTLEAAATQAALLAQRFGVEPQRISWDFTGIGSDFANRLAAVGLLGCKPYRGADAGPAGHAVNLRAAAAWAAQRRLDPRRALPEPPAPRADPARNPFGILAPTGARIVRLQHPFAIPREFLDLLRPEVEAHHYALAPSGGIELERAEDVARRLRHSPDFAAAFFQSFAFTG